MRGRFNHALGFGAAGFSEGMVCAAPQPAGAAVSAETPAAIPPRTPPEPVAGHAGATAS
jgi:hypothetical protein